MMLRYAAEILSVPGIRVQALLDPSPLAANLERWLDWPVVHENVASGVVSALAVIASSTETGRSVAFVEHGGGERLPEHPSHDIEYVAAQLQRPHIEASAAIPFLFPPVRIDAPGVAAGWYFDGGTRLNTPIKPALELGAQRVLIISTDAVAPPPLPADAHEPPPDFGTGALHLLDRALVDPLIRDLRHLAHINTYLADAAQETALLHYRTARGKPPYRQIPYLFVAPERRYEIGSLAADVLRSKYGGAKALRDPDIPLLDRLLGRDSPAHRELFSYLFFDHDFVSELIAMGRQDARRWLTTAIGPAAPWRVEALPEFSHRAEMAAAAAEAA